MRIPYALPARQGGKRFRTESSLYFANAPRYDRVRAFEIRPLMLHERVPVEVEL